MMRTIIDRLLHTAGVRSSSWGDWRAHQTAAETPHYAIIERWRQQYCPTGSVLDLGCGAGLVPKNFPAPVPYLGIDLQAAAIKTARHHLTDGQRVIRGNITDLAHVGAESFDLILFNEVLYYLPSVACALRAIQMYEPIRTATGYFLISIWIDNNHPERPNAAVWKAVRDRYAERSVSTIYVPWNDDSGWQIGLFR